MTARATGAPLATHAPWDPTMSHPVLPFDVLATVFDFCDFSSLYRLCLTSRDINAAASIHLYRTVYIDPWAHAHSSVSITSQLLHPYLTSKFRAGVPGPELCTLLSNDGRLFWTASSPWFGLGNMILGTVWSRAGARCTSSSHRATPSTRADTCAGSLSPFDDSGDYAPSSIWVDLRSVSSKSSPSISGP